MTHFKVLFLLVCLPLASAAVVKKSAVQQRKFVSVSAPAIRVTPVRPTTTAFKSCTVGGLRLVTQAGAVRSATHGISYPDNRLRVVQTYDRAGRLSSISVNWSGFAGQIVNTRASYTPSGRLIKEMGYRREGFTTPLKSYLKQLPKGAKC